MGSFGENEDREDVRREALAQAANETLDSIPQRLEEMHGKEWAAVLVLQFIRSSFVALRTSLEDADEAEISWSHPWAELRIPADWNFDAAPGEESAAFQKTLPIPSEGAESEFFEEVARVAYSQLEQAFLSSLTNAVVIAENPDGTRELLVPDHLRAELELDDLPDEERAKALDFLARPFSWGAVDVEFPEFEDLEEGEEKPLSPEVVSDLYDRLQPAITFTGTTEDGYQFGWGLVFQLSPLTLDEAAREAFFRVTVGLQFWPLDPEEVGRILDDRGGTDGWLPPGFDDESAGCVWDATFKGLDELLEAIRGFEKFAGAIRESASKKVETLEARPTARPEEVPFYPDVFGHARIDANVQKFITNVHKISFPAKRWSTLPTWEELKRQEVARILEEHGERALDDLRAETGNANARPPLLSVRYRHGKDPIYSLTETALEDLKIAKGLGRGFRQVDDRSGDEYFTRLFHAGGGYIEIGLSWKGLAGPWVEEWRKLLEKRTLEAAEQQPSLFDILDEKRKGEVDELFRRLHMVKDSHLLMEALLAHGTVQSTNAVVLSAYGLRDLLGLRDDRNWNKRLERALEALKVCFFKLDTLRIGKVEGARTGAFLLDWTFIGQRARKETGLYRFIVNKAFFGCLEAFQSEMRDLPEDSAEVLRLDFSKKPTKEKDEALGWRKAGEKAGKAPQRFVEIDAGRGWYSKAAGLNDQQHNLERWIEREITLQGSAVSRTTFPDYERRKQEQARRGSPKGRSPRTYTNEDCPLLEPGKRYHGALGNFSRNAEVGRTLFGTSRRAHLTGGQHVEGLLSAMGIHLSSGKRAVKERRRVVRAALENMVAVVVEYLGGVVAARIKGNWLSLEEAAALGEHDILREAKWLLFVPEDWKERRVRQWEETEGFRVSRTSDEAERGRRAIAEGIIPRLNLQKALPAPEKSRPANVGLEGLDLPRRLHAARKQRGLTQAAVGTLFGVSQAAVAFWEAGTEPDEDGKVRGKPIAEDLVPLVVRWVETGEAPTADELAARRK